MYNDTIKVANKIISENDLLDIFQKMNDEILENQQLVRRETLNNAGKDINSQNWTLKDFSPSFKCTFNFYDDTNITVDNYNSFITLFNSRLNEIKDLWLRYSFSYWMKQNGQTEYVSQHIYMTIFEHKMDIEVNLSSKDQRMDDVFRLIKEKVLTAPERYDRIIKNKSSIVTKITFALGLIPSIILCFLLALIPAVREVYSATYVLFPIAVILLGFTLGPTIFSGKLNSLYSTLSPKKKYAGYDTKNMKSVYKDDIDDYLNKSEIIIGKNVDNLKKRAEIAEMEEKYSKYIPTEMIITLVLSIIVVLLGKIF